jgi:ribosomal-protein-alanine N-acetyltransferase
LEEAFARQVGDYIIRRATFQDLPKVIRINWVTLPEHYADFFFEDLLRRVPEAFLVAELEGEVVGYIMCRVEMGFSNLSRFSITRKGHIISVAVLESHRRRGLGRALVEEALAGLKSRGCSEAYLEVRVSNTPAITLYQHLGFAIVNRLEGYYRDGEAAYLMAKPLE